MKKSNFNIIYFLLIFCILYYGFYIYIALATPGGKFYYPFLYNYLNIPYWLSAIVAKAAAALLRVAGYATYQKSPINITIESSRGVNIAWGCVGIGPMTAWLAFIVAHKAKAAYKMKWIFLGFALIYIVNTIRIAMIALSYHYHWKYLESFDAHKTYNILAYIIIILMMFVFVRFYNKKIEQVSKISG